MGAAIDHAVSIWLQAANSPFGVGLIVTDPNRARHSLYRARDALSANGLDLSNYTIRTSPDNPAYELWVIRTPRTNPHQPAPPSAAGLDDPSAMWDPRTPSAPSSNENTPCPPPSTSPHPSGT